MQPALTEAVYYILLSLLQPMHGYGIMQNTEALSEGRVRLAAGTLYGALNTLLIGIMLPAAQIALWSVAMQIISAVQQLHSTNVIRFAEDSVPWLMENFPSAAFRPPLRLSLPLYRHSRK